jgi:hypothetical protein
VGSGRDVLMESVLVSPFENMATRKASILRGSIMDRDLGDSKSRHQHRTQFCYLLRDRENNDGNNDEEPGTCQIAIL